MTYQGSTNYETWNVELWVDNEYPLYLKKIRLFDRTQEPITVEQVKEFVNGYMAGDPDGSEGLRTKFVQSLPFLLKIAQDTGVPFKPNHRYVLRVALGNRVERGGIGRGQRGDVHQRTDCVLSWFGKQGRHRYGLEAIRAYLRRAARRGRCGGGCRRTCASRRGFRRRLSGR